ncbi:unnamed protein product [Allacma fusca]|uniref:Uncharacterized protein n=1 Tax=Allacma fusca TaxID=39272 RepID=A0A8J2L705_9HEXA|nr:unnamed protein product [Allacma fusca]
MYFRLWSGNQRWRQSSPMELQLQGFTTSPCLQSGLMYVIVVIARTSTTTTATPTFSIGYQRSGRRLILFSTVY